MKYHIATYCTFVVSKTMATVKITNPYGHICKEELQIIIVIIHHIEKINIAYNLTLNVV